MHTSAMSDRVAAQTQQTADVRRRRDLEPSLTINAVVFTERSYEACAGVVSTREAWETFEATVFKRAREIL